MRLKYSPNDIALNDKVSLLHKITEKNSPLHYVKLAVLSFKKGGSYHEKLEDFEVCIVVIEGKVEITDSKKIFSHVGSRKSVFEKKTTDSVYVSNDQMFKVTAETEAKIILCYAPSHEQLPSALIKAEDNGVEHRGKGANKRLVHNILDDNSHISNSLLIVEVFTESGNWSSYPPHKHDQDNLPYESLLEESYYHEIFPRQGFIFQRVYTDDRLLDETMTVENGEVVVVPKGYHPVGVPDGYQSYYLNIMAGPVKKWRFHNDPAHEWLLK